MANSVDPDQAAPIGADDIFRCIFVLGALRVKKQQQTKKKPTVIIKSIKFEALSKLNKIASSSLGLAHRSIIFQRSNLSSYDPFTNYQLD